VASTFLLALWMGFSWITLIIPIILGLGAGYFGGHEARAAGSERLATLDEEFDRYEVELAELKAALAEEVTDALEPSPAVIWREWRDGPLHCSSTPKLTTR
jgi:hypothetical protein